MRAFSGVLSALRRGGNVASLQERDLGVRWFAAAPEAAKDEDDPLVAQGARELGLDRVPLKDLQALSRDSLLGKEALELDVMQPKKKRLTFGDIPGAMDLLEPFEPRNAPREPVYDSHEWVNTHYPRYGYAARGPLYSWRDWAAAALPPGDAAAHLAVERLMGDDEKRGGLVRQAQWELARLWDWQQRRAELGLSPDLPPAAAGGGAGGGAGAQEGDAAGGGGRRGRAERAEGGARQEGAGAEVEEGGGGGEKGVLGVLARTGVHERSASAGEAAARMLPPGDGLGDMPYGEWAVAALEAKPARERAALLDMVRSKMEEGRRSRQGGRRRLQSAMERVYTPRRDGEDLFLPALPYDSEAAASAQLPPADMNAVSAWGALKALDRGALEERLVAELAKKVAPRLLGRQGARWEPVDDGWSFDLGVRPPTRGLDLLTDYLEVKYRDLLLKRDAVTTLQRRAHAARLAASGGEAAELPPSALAAPGALAPAERARVTRVLNDALAAGDLARYRRTAEMLYAAGLISAGDMGACLAAAAAAADAAAAAAAAAGAGEGPEDREALFGLLSGAAPPPAAGDPAAAAWSAAAARAGGGARAMSLDDARRAWARVLARAGLEGAPGLDELLRAGGGDVPPEGLHERIARLQPRLGGPQAPTALEAGGAGASSSSSSGSSSSSSDDEARSAAAPAPGGGPGGEGASTPADAGGAAGTGWQEQLWARLAAAAGTSSSSGGGGGGGGGGDLLSGGSEEGVSLGLAALQERYRRELEAAAPTQAPYPGATRLLRWQQALYFHASASSEPHPDERKAVLRVNAAELAKEARLTPAARRHMLRVAGLAGRGGRYDPATGDIKLTCNRFPTREENRRWCLAALHRLLAEADAAAPSGGFVFGEAARRRGSGCGSPFLGDP